LERATLARMDGLAPRIGKLFHLAHLVEDLDATDRLYDEVFACERYYRGYERAARRDASLVVVCDQCMEPIAPSADPADAQTPLARFKSRFGNRLHSIAWYVDDIEPFIARLLSHGVRLYGLTGKPVTDPAATTAVWTHPGDTGALLEFCPSGFAPDPRLQPGWSTGPWRQHPLGLLRTSHVTVLFDDVALGHRVYGDFLGGQLLHTDTSDPRAARWFYAIGEDTIVELAVPADDATPEGRDLAAAGNAVHAVTFTTADLGRAAAFLAEQGISTTYTSDHEVHLDLAPAHGLNLLLTDRTIPGDSRA
jgi:catechol 2,3-dioxygenase-like lactoylglutathione lyase family enzyme